MFPPFAGLFQFTITGIQNLFFASRELVLGRDVAEGRVQAHGVVVFNEFADNAACIFQGQRRARADAFFLEDAMPAFDLAVALRIVRRGPRMRHAADANELLEIPGNELRAIVGDNTRPGVRESFSASLNDLLDVGLGHRLAQLPVDDEPAAAIEQAAQVVEGAGDVDVGDIDVPVLVGPQRLDEALALGGGLGRVAVEQARLLEDTVDALWGYRRRCPGRAS